MKYRIQPAQPCGLFCLRSPVKVGAGRTGWTGWTIGPLKEPVKVVSTDWRCDVTGRTTCRGHVKPL